MSIIERARQLRTVIEKASAGLPDQEALEVPELFPAWSCDVEYVTGERIRYEGILYMVLQTHTSQSDWTPDTAVSLFAKVLIPNPEEIPDWERPESTNPYMTGDKIRFKGIIYESMIDSNVWSPEEYPAGWVSVT